MSVLAKAAALLEAATLDELDAMPPAEQRRLAELLWHWSQLADRRARGPAPKSGVRAQLNWGDRAP